MSVSGPVPKDHPTRIAARVNLITALTPMFARPLFALLILFVPLVGCAQAQSPANAEWAQKLSKAEQAMSAKTQERMTSIRAGNSVRRGFLAKSGDLWFGTDQGAFRYDGKSFTHISVEDGLSNNQVFAIVDDEDGNIWFGTAHGLCRFDGKAFTHIPLPWSDLTSPWVEKLYPLINPNQVSCLLRAKDGGLWVGTFGAGAYRYDGETFTQYLSAEGMKYDDGLPHNWIHEIIQDAGGNIWFTSMSWGGVSRFDGKEFTHFLAEDGLSDSMTRSAFQDREGNLWFGSNGNRNGGLDRFDGKTFTEVNKQTGHDHPNIQSIYEDRTGKLWLACGLNGVCTFDGKSFTPFTKEGGQKFGPIHFFVEDAEGKLWFGGSKGTLFRYDSEKITDHSFQSSNPSRLAK